MLVNAVLAAGVAGSVLVGIRWTALRGAAVPAEVSPPSVERIELPRVARLLRELRLITVEITAPVESESEDRSWRGDARAVVTAPVRVYYGVDLSGLSEAGVLRDPLDGSLVVRVPEPRRLAAEVFTADGESHVRVSGTRLRDVAGEYHLGLARVRLQERARALVLSPEQKATVERLTREQVATLVRAIAGPEAPVRVEFGPAEIGADRSTAAAGETATQSPAR